MRMLVNSVGFVSMGFLLAVMTLGLALAVHPLAAFVLVLAIPALYFFAQYPVWGIALTVAAIPLEGLGRFTSSESAVIVSVAKLFGLATAVALALNVLLGRTRLRIPVEAIYLLIFCLVGMLTMFYTTDLQNGLPRVVSFITTTVFFVVIVNAVRTEDNLRLVVTGLLVSTAAVGVFAISQRILPGFTIFDVSDSSTDAMGVHIDLSEQTTLGGEVRRSGGTSGSPHVYAANLLVAIPLYIYAMRVNSSQLWRLLALVGLTLALANLLLTHTRSGLITCLPVFGLMIWRGLVRINLRTILLGIVAMGFLLLVLPESVSVRLFDLERYSVDGAATLKTRLDYWAAGLEMLQRNWLFGMGMGNFSDLAHYEPTVTLGHAFMHNIYLQLFNEVGIFGFAAIMLFLGTILWRFERVYRRVQLTGAPRTVLLVVALESSVLSGMVLGFTMDYLHFAVKDWWFAAAAATCLRAIYPRH